MKSNPFACTLAFALFTGVSSIMAFLVNSIVIRPYMDEIFHIPQAQKYCQGNFTYWDPKITTPPGLYLLSIGLLKPLIRLFPDLIDCGAVDLRSINLVFSFGNFYLCSAIINKLNEDTKTSNCWHSAVTALTLSSFPPLYFFTFLYYTDVGSTFTVLLAYLFALNKNHFLASAIGFFAVLFRQTNVIWVAFLGFLALNDLLEKYASKELKKTNKSSWKYLRVALHSSFQLVLNRRQQGLFSLIGNFALFCGGYLCVGIASLAFVVWNQGVVLGDRAAHRATVHLPQVLYFSAFTLFFAFPHLVGGGLTRHLLAGAKRYKSVVAGATLLVGTVVAVNTLTHPYLLADNRHYSFYVWRKVQGCNSWAKFLPVPVYLYAGVGIFEVLRRQQGLLWTVGYFACLAAALVPHELLEFRYFILPYLIFRLNAPPTKDALGVLFEVALNSLVNFGTLYLFLMRPFVWPDQDVLQRFMW